MLKCRSWALATASLLASFVVGSSSAAVWEDDFSSNPASREWRVFGDASLFRWNATNKNFEVTWDSTRTNSYFFHPLGTILAKDDDFSLAFDLRLVDIVGGVVPGRTGPFEIAIGFLHLADATNANFRRGTGGDSPNLVEFDYFPAGSYPDWGMTVDPTVSPTIISSNVQFATGFTTPLEMTNRDSFRVTLSYAASNQTLVTTLLRNGQPFAPVSNTVLTASFTDFRVDAVSINSYSDAGDSFDSVLAHGVVDNLVVTVPDRPKLAGGFAEGFWRTRRTSRTNWTYLLERATGLTNWTAVSARLAGTGAAMSLTETNRPAGAAAFYRVRADRP